MEVSIKLSDFKKNLKDVCRPNRFRVTIDSNSDLCWIVKAASIPGRTIGEVVLNHQGMQTKFPGDPTFDDFSVTFFNDYNMTARKFICKWLEDIARMKDNIREVALKVCKEIKVEQLGRTGETKATYKLINAHPKQLDAIDLSSESNDTAEEFPVQFSYDYFEEEFK